MKKEIKGRSLVINKCSFDLDKDQKLDYKDYAIALMISVFHIGGDDTNDGKMNMIYKAKATTGAVKISSEHEKVYIKTHKGSQSQVLRFALYNYNDTDMENEDFYKKVMSILIDNPDRVVQLAKEINGGF